MFFSSLLRTRQRYSPTGTQRGFTLVEVIITMAVMTILTMGVLPFVKLSVRRQKEEQLRATLRDIRRAIDEFHRDTMGGPCDSASGPRQPQNPTAGMPQGQGQGQNAGVADPRSRVVISDCKIFKSDNPDRFPPDLETLVSGVNVIPRGGSGMGGGRGDMNVNATELNSGGAILADKKKVYLRNLPVDPITGEAEWELRSVYQDKDASSWDGLNVFDVRSKASGTGLNDKKYSDW